MVYTIESLKIELKKRKSNKEHKMIEEIKGFITNKIISAKEQQSKNYMASSYWLGALNNLYELKEFIEILENKKCSNK